jgi:isopropylmalate/homocitrate/citramalate synthase
VELNGIYLTDTTLRDGQQGFGYFTAEESLQLYEVPVELNSGGRVIASTEVFLCTDKDRVVARRLLELGYNYPRVVGWIRASRSDLSLVSEARLEETVVPTSISDYHLYYKLGLSRGEALERYLGIISEAYGRGLTVKCALEDVTRADPSFVALFPERYLELAEREGFEAFSNRRRRPLSDIEVAEIVKNVMPDVLEAYVKKRPERLEL